MNKKLLCVGVAWFALVAAAPVMQGLPPRDFTSPKSITSPAGPILQPIPLADLSFLRDIGGAVWTADGRDVIISTNLTGRFNLWSLPLDGGFPLQLSQSEESQQGVATSLDGKSILYESDVGGNIIGDLFLIPRSGGASRNLTKTADVAENGATFSPDGKSLAFSRRPKDATSSNIAVMNIATGAVRELTREKSADRSWRVVAYSPNGRHIFANRVNADGSRVAVWQIDVATGKATDLLGDQPGALSEASAISNDGKYLAVTVRNSSGLKQAGILDLATRQLKMLSPNPWEQSTGSFSPDSRRLNFMTNVDSRIGLSIYEIDKGTARTLDLPPGITGESSGIGISAYSPDGRKLLFVHTSGNRPSDLWVADMQTGETKPITRLGIASIDPEKLPKTQIVTYASADGTPISAIMTMPPNLPRNGSAPAIVLPHGGPDEQQLDGFDATSAALVSRGYVLIAPNFRGSTGYGKAFMAANHKDLGGGDLTDVIYAKKFLVDTGYVDAKRVGITGGSYGGYMTLMALAKTPDEFAAGVEAYGIVNWYTMYVNQDTSIQQYQRTLIGEPETNKAVYDASSPITFIHQIKSPLLVLQGINDPIVPKQEAEQVVEILKKDGKVVDAKFYPDEGHGFDKRENVLDALSRTINWFDKYLKK